jgi:hypothetical protein
MRQRGVNAVATSAANQADAGLSKSMAVGRKNSRVYFCLTHESLFGNESLEKDNKGIPQKLPSGPWRECKGRGSARSTPRVSAASSYCR